MFITSPSLGVNNLTNGYTAIVTPSRCYQGGLTSTAGRGYTSFGTVTSGVFTAYQVPVGKTFYLKAIAMHIFSATVGTSNGFLGYNDNDLGFNDGAAPVNPVRLFGDGGTSFAAGDIMPSTELGRELIILDQPFAIPATKYPYALLSSVFNAIIYIYGDEQ